MPYWQEYSRIENPDVSKIIMRGDSRPVCYHFRNIGYCSYGARCKFSHEKQSRLVSTRARGKTIKEHRSGAEEDLNAVASFFSTFPDFPYNCKRGVAEEFYRMCDFFAWEKDDEERKRARRAFKDAMVIRFNGLYGTDVTRIGNWHKLCVAVHIEPLPVTIAQCREKVKTIHVNLVDLVDTPGRDAELFKSLEELQEYTVETGKFFPKESAYAGGILKFLLREIL